MSQLSFIAGPLAQHLKEEMFKFVETNVTVQLPDGEQEVLFLMVLIGLAHDLAAFLADDKLSFNDFLDKMKAPVDFYVDGHETEVEN